MEQDRPEVGEEGDPFAVKSGKLSTDLNVNFAISGDTPTIRIEGTADLADLAVTDKSNAPLVAARALHVKIANAEPLRDIYHSIESFVAELLILNQGAELIEYDDQSS